MTMHPVKDCKNLFYSSFGYLREVFDVQSDHIGTEMEYIDAFEF
jgi:hypothetical protein